MAPEKPKTLEKPKPTPHWYELDWLLPYRDLLLILGGGLVTVGVAMLNVPAALIVAGAGLASLAWRMAER